MYPTRPLVVATIQIDETHTLGVEFHKIVDDNLATGLVMSSILGGAECIFPAFGLI